MIKISIIIPVYNRTEYIQQCIESILTQNLREIEILCIDDESDEHCVKILEMYEKSYQGLYVFRKKHEGAWAARNFGVQMAKGEYVCFMDSDDYYADNSSLESLYIHAKNNKALICGGKIVNVYENGKMENRGYDYKFIGFHNCILEPQMNGHTRYIYDRKFLIENNLKNYPYRRFEDPPFVLETFLKAKKVYIIDKVIYCCRQYERNRKYSYEVLVDILKGLLDCYLMAINNDLTGLLDYGLTPVLSDLYSDLVIYIYINDDIVCNLLEEIKQRHIALGGCDISYLDKDMVNKKVHSLEYIKKKLDNANSIVIYGAGAVGQKLYDSKVINKKKLLGFGVSNDISNRKNVNYIGDYFDKEPLIVIAVEKDKAEEMESLLRKYNYKYYVYLNSSDIAIIEYLMNIT